MAGAARCTAACRTAMQSCLKMLIFALPDSGEQLLEILARAVLVSGVAAALTLFAPVAFAGDVYEGDTLEIEGQRARLYGIDAFELGQTCLDGRGRPWRCGIAAKAALAERIEGQTLQCVVLAEDRDGW